MSTTLTESPAPTRKSLVTDEQKQLFKDEGYMLLESVVPPEHLKLMRDKCQGFIDKADAVMTAKGIERSGLNAKGKRYFEAYAYKQEPELGKFVFSDLMADVCRATIGGNVFLFWDQYVVKGTDKDSAFSWHQDSGYVHLDCPEYLTCWVTLDDVTLENGTVFLLPYSESGIRSVVKHQLDPRTNDLVGYFGKNPGIPVVLPAGSIAVFSSYVFHRSGPNLTDKLRRIYLPQYTPEIIRHKEGGQWGQAIPFLKDGEIVWKEGMPYPEQPKG
jgi:ectoine hydroxylase-related dioxygenase (phytanoyl-CoA dioxygenase family)